MVNSLGVVIVTYNGSQWIERCLESVFHSSIPLHCIVVDNNSSDNTTDIIKNKFPQTRLICSKKNQGFGKANNIGIRKLLELGTDYIYLLNQDAWVNHNTFERLADILNKHQEYGIISPIQLTGKGDRLDKRFLINSASPNFTSELLNDYLMNNPIKDVYATLFVMAAHWMIRSSYLLRVGLFSPAFPHYGEDTNLVQRFQYFNYKIGLCPSIFGFHDRSERRETPESNLRSFYINNMALWHNVLKSDVKFRVWGCLRLAAKIFFLRGIGFPSKLKVFYRMIGDAYTSKAYKNYYLQGSCYL